MGKDRIKFVYAGALIVFVIQMLLIILNFLNGQLYVHRGPEYDALSYQSVLDTPGFMDVIGLTWSSLIGTVGLIVVFVYRIMKGPMPFFELIGMLLWIVQIYFLYEKSKPTLDVNMATYNFLSFMWAYILAFLGVLAMIVVTVYDFSTYKKK